MVATVSDSDRGLSSRPTEEKPTVTTPLTVATRYLRSPANGERVTLWDSHPSTAARPSRLAGERTRRTRAGEGPEAKDTRSRIRQRKILTAPVIGPPPLRQEHPESKTRATSLE